MRHNLGDVALKVMMHKQTQWFVIPEERGEEGRKVDKFGAPNLLPLNQWIFQFMWEEFPHQTSPSEKGGFAFQLGYKKIGEFLSRVVGAEVRAESLGDGKGNSLTK
jgi:hypothetical protein